MTIAPGMKVRYLPQPGWGVGHVLKVHPENAQALVAFAGRAGDPIIVSEKNGQLVRHLFAAGEKVIAPGGAEGTVVAGDGARVTVRLAGGVEVFDEGALRARPPAPDFLEMLREGQAGDARHFVLRKQALALDDERRCDALGALFASRVKVLPHQIGVVQRVLSAPAPRFILADEVGLGKTIEAGMILTALAQAGLARRVLVVAPHHLTVQWLQELRHKFNQTFTLMDGERYDGLHKAGLSPWQSQDKIVTSLELVSRGAKHAAEASDAGWDLVIFDEAHHLKAEKAYAAATAVAARAWGVLLLTATPMQLDPEEYFALLRLLDPERGEDLAGFKARMAKQEALAAAAEALLGGGAKALAAIKKRFADDATLSGLDTPRAALEHLAETYSLSENLVRNRRSVVGGFATRQLVRHAVAGGGPDAAQILADLGAASGEGVAGGDGATMARGAVLAGLLRRLESSPAALRAALGDDAAPAWLSAPRDRKRDAFIAALEEIWAGEPEAKVLVFSEARETIEMLRQALAMRGVEALGYHGDLSIIERDRHVARFRDPEGVKVLLCTELGGEGRNFQFAHHLVNYDLPWSPAMIEQRIGRLDRVGQTHPVMIHAFDVEGSLAAFVLSLFADAIGVFGETIGGLDAALEEVEGEIAALALRPAAERETYARALKAKVAAAREAARRGYDPLLDVRSFDAEAVRALLARGKSRLGITSDDDDEVDARVRADEAPALEEDLLLLARDLDERLEETVTALARKIGIQVDTDEQVEAFQCAFHFGYAINVEALAGIDVHQDKTVLGTFWRDTANEHEEIDYFATGHPLVEALFAMLRDGPFGRTGVRVIPHRRGARARGFEFLFHVEAPDDASAGAGVPARQIARFILRTLVRVIVAEGEGGRPEPAPALARFLDSDGDEQVLTEVERAQALAAFGPFTDAAIDAARDAAGAELEKIAADARAAITRERDAVCARLALALAHQEVASAHRAEKIARVRAHYDHLLAALPALRVTLDAACGFALV